MKYVIHKSSRMPGVVSYTGSTLDRAGLRGEYKETYEDREEAENFAKQLGQYNPVGFEVNLQQHSSR